MKVCRGSKYSWTGDTEWHCTLTMWKFRGLVLLSTGGVSTKELLAVEEGVLNWRIIWKVRNYSNVLLLNYIIIIIFIIITITKKLYL